jgi:hypothetical protein
MKVLNLQCAGQHSFEGWFASEDDFQSQCARGLVTCPLCADTEILKLPSAPRLNFGARAAQSNGSAGASPEMPTEAVASTSSDQAAPNSMSVNPSATGQAAFLTALRQMLANTEDVGHRFVNEARRMHYGETPTRGIRGQASTEQAMELLEEGIDVMPIPLPAALKETLQ